MIDVSKLKTHKTILVNSKVEVALVRPGVITENGVDSTIKKDEDRIKLLDVFLIQKIRG